MKILFIYNPYSGKKVNNAKEKFLNYIEASEHYCIFFETKPAYGGYDYIMETDQKFDVIVSIGGDGTISKTVDAICKRDLDAKLLIVPTGSTNEYAQSLNLVFNTIEESLKLIDEGEVKTIDVGQINDAYFTYVAAFGNFTAASYETPQKWKNVIGHFAYWIYGAIKLNTIRNYHYRVFLDDNVQEETFLFGLISNAYQFGRIFKYPKETVSLNDGLFEVLLIKNPDSIKDYIQLLHRIVLQDYDHPLFIKTKTSHIIFESTHRNYTWNIDGEKGSKQDHTEIKVLKDKLKILVPKENESK